MGTTHRTGTCMPRAQWPGMWQPTTHGVADAGPSAGTVQTRSTSSPDLTTIRTPATPGGTRDHGRRPRGRSRRRRLGHLPGVLDRRVADDRLVDLEAAVDDVEEDRLARDEVDRIGQEGVVLGDDVDRARSGRGARHDRRRRRGGAPSRRPRGRSRAPVRPRRNDGRHAAREHDEGHGAKSMTRRTGRGAASLMPALVQRFRLANQLPLVNVAAVLDPAVRSSRSTWPRV